MLSVLDTPQAAAAWLAAQVSGTLQTDSRRLRAGDGFIAWPGYATDGRRFVPDALAAGAAACLVEADGAAAFGFDDERIAALPGLKAATGTIAHTFFGQPSAALQISAVTGTNGKTSTAWWTAQALSRLGRRCGVVGTLGVGEPDAVVATGLTTPDPVTLHGALRSMVDQGFAACALEASSIGLVEHRLDALHIDVALFTNFTRDHLDFHGSMDAYWAAKRALFSWPGLRAAVVNIDDAQGAALALELAAGPQAHALDLWTVSMRAPARLRGERLQHAQDGLTFDAVEGAVRIGVQTRLVGDYNASNVLGMLAGLRALGVPLADAAAVAATLTPVPGRLQRVTGVDVGVSANDSAKISAKISANPSADNTADNTVDVIVDYAHTPDALDKALQALRPLAAARGGLLWCVFGCGGDRDITKRPLMGAIAARHADHVVITSDNPRAEVPATILSQILAGVPAHRAVEVIEDRREAIHHAVQRAAAGDVVLLAGKGHEDYQEVAGIQRPFSDVAEAQAALQSRSAATALSAAEAAR
ncbi:MAG: UDP-N-acetylmuramoyl-L-alanyl-D-glutamate--2,6-diaminopimelate ligase [Rubrivivax sp.]|nr:UDP-N-acetylmuramoyl-L-alanyl-D-glutamate--2,6-diaminopimelate ligase [Rubrivivax sp.]